jgi:hypothetical protein
MYGETKRKELPGLRGVGKRECGGGEPGVFGLA